MYACPYRWPKNYQVYTHIPGKPYLFTTNHPKKWQVTEIIQTDAHVHGIFHIPLFANYCTKLLSVFKMLYTLQICCFVCNTCPSFLLNPTRKNHKMLTSGELEGHSTDPWGPMWSGTLSLGKVWSLHIKWDWASSCNHIHHLGHETLQFPASLCVCVCVW